MGAWFDASDLSTLSQTSDGNTPVTANDNPVAYLKCKVTGTPLTQAVDANRPLWKAASSISGKPGLEFDGSNDYLFATSGGLMDVARNVNGFTAFTVVQSADLSSRVFWHLAVGGASSYFRARMSLAYISPSGLRAGGRRLDGDLFEFAENTSFLASTPYVATAVADYANAQATLQLNGGVPATDSPFLTSGNTSNTASSHVMLGGQFTNDAFTAVSGLFSGTFCEWLVYRRTLSTAEISRVERYLSNKYGIALA